LGYAYVNFHNVQDAERALDTMNFTDIKGRPCRIMWSQRDPSLRKSGVGNVFVKNLASTIDNKGLFDIFSVFGNILSCKVATDEQGLSKGYGYVHYETAEAAQEAINKINGYAIDEMEVVVGPFVRRQERAGQSDWTNLYVKEFPESWEEDKLMELFGTYGSVTSIKVARDPENRSRKFGFVNFAEHSSAEAALTELNGKSLEDPATGAFVLYVNRAQKRTERTRDIRNRMDAMRQDRMSKYQGMNLYVKNLDDEVTDEELKNIFSPYGTITSARIMRDDQGSKGFGFVCFSTPQEATRAVTEVNNKMIRSKPIFVTLHQRKEHRRAHLAATYGSRMGMPRGFPAAPMPYMYMNPNTGMQPGMMPGQPPRQPFQMMPPNMMQQQNPRGGPRGVPGFRQQQQQPPGAYPMMPYNMPQQGPAGGVGQSFKRPPMNGQGPVSAQNPGRGIGGRGGAPGGRGSLMPAVPGRGPLPPQQVPRVPANLKYTAQARNQPPVGAMPMMNGPPQGMNVPPPNPMVQHQSQMMGHPLSEPLDHQMLAQADPTTQKNMIGERLYPLIHRVNPELAGKITGMLLEMDNSELLHLLESPDSLASKIDEALLVLRMHSTTGNNLE